MSAWRWDRIPASWLEAAHCRHCTDGLADTALVHSALAILELERRLVDWHLGLLEQIEGDSLGIHSRVARILVGQGESEGKIDSVDILVGAIEDSVLADMVAEGSSVDGEGHSLVVSSLE